MEATLQEKLKNKLMMVATKLNQKPVCLPCESSTFQFHRWRYHVPDTCLILRAFQQNLYVGFHSQIIVVVVSIAVACITTLEFHELGSKEAQSTDRRTHCIISKCTSCSWCHSRQVSLFATYSAELPNLHIHAWQKCGILWHHSAKIYYSCSDTAGCGEV